CAWHAMIRPEHLLMTVELDHVHGRSPRVAAREGNVAFRVPILGRHIQSEEVSTKQTLEGAKDLVCVLHRKRTSREEIRLDIDHQKG
ncbi:MAG: hypothetical protein V3S98_09810, partial [Dehalococcoidia bacterium]